MGNGAGEKGRRRRRRRKGTWHINMPKKIGFVLPYLICHQFQASLSSKWLEKRLLEAALHSLLTINLRSKTSHCHSLQQTAATHETHASCISHKHLTLLQRRSKAEDVTAPKQQRPIATLRCVRGREIFKVLSPVILTRVHRILLSLYTWPMTCQAIKWNLVGTYS
jgi:hypothetical protein